MLFVFGLDSVQVGYMLQHDVKIEMPCQWLIRGVEPEVFVNLSDGSLLECSELYTVKT
jgi:hypothetical protein